MVNHFDIGTVLFREILQISQYPGAPFSGQILNDIVLFFFIPTVFLVMLVYFILGMLFTPEHRAMRLLVGLAIYMFILFGGFFSIFALLAGPLFIWLIFGLGLVYFLARFLPGISLGRGGALRGGKEFKVKELRERLETLKVELDAAVAEGDRKAVREIRQQIKDVEDKLERLTGSKFGVAA